MATPRDYRDRATQIIDRCVEHTTRHADPRARALRQFVIRELTIARLEGCLDGVNDLVTALDAAKRRQQT